MPALAVGVSDSTTSFGGDYLTPITDYGNAYFNRLCAVASKHFETKLGLVGAHLGYQYNRRQDMPFNSPCFAIDWEPVWLMKDDIIKTKIIAEYDARTFNVGAIITLWKNHFEAMIELQALKWINAGIRYKHVLKS